jgi:hypothetical protein
LSGAVHKVNLENPVTLLAFCVDEGPADVIAKVSALLVGAQHEGSSEIGFPLFEYRPQIKEENVVLTDR